MIDKPLTQITKANIEALVAKGNKEDRTTEYKEALPGGSDAERKEFLADIVSLTFSGGDLIFGIEEERDTEGKPTGVPKAAHGVVTANVLAARLGLESGIRDGIAPRIHGVLTHHVPGFARGPVIIVRIRQSMNTPHMVTYKGSSRFYGRNSAGKYPLDINEIRGAFLAAEALPQRLRDFRAERLNLVLAGDTPVPIAAGPTIVLHVVPAASLVATARPRVDLHELMISEVMPIYGGINEHRFNFDGRMACSTTGYDNTRVSTSYVQIFHTGAIEAVDTSILLNAQTDRLYIPHTAFERQVISALERYLRAIRSYFRSEPPIYAMLSLLNVRDYSIILQSAPMTTLHHSIDRDNLLIPELLIEDVTTQPTSILKPAFDIIWQSCGYPGSINYADDGTWRAG